jgi:hypothetical protein
MTTIDDDTRLTGFDDDTKEDNGIDDAGKQSV